MFSVSTVAQAEKNRITHAEQRIIKDLVIMHVPDGIIYCSISLLNFEELNLPETPKEFKENIIKSSLCFALIMKWFIMFYAYPGTKTVSADHQQA